MTASANLSPSSSLLPEVRQTIQRAPFFVPLPKDLTNAFTRQRQSEFEKSLPIGAPAAVIFCLVILAVGHLFLGEEMQETAGQLWRWVATGNTVIVTLAAILLHFHFFRSNYQWTMGVTGSGIMFTVMMLSITLSDHRLAQGMSYIVMLLIVIVSLALRLGILTAGLACFIGGITAIAAAKMLFNQWPDWWQLLHYFVGALGVSLFVSWLLERQERLSFLKSVLLEFESHERERLNRELELLARQDALTGLANRRSFDERLIAEWDRSLRGQHELALLFIDVDHFKKYNDHYGHSMGDDCLAAIASVIHGALLRPADLASRYGGEEFVVLLPETSHQGAKEVAERILNGIEIFHLPHAASTTADYVTVSIGLTSCIPDTGLAQALLDSADSALYTAKRNGRNQIASARKIAPVSFASE